MPDPSSTLTIIPPAEDEQFHRSSEQAGLGPSTVNFIYPGTNSSEVGMKDYVDAKHETALTKIDAAVSKFLAEVKTKANRLDVWLAALAVAGVVIGAVLTTLAIGGDRFDGGMSAASVSVWEAEGARQNSLRNAEQIDALTIQIDRFLKVQQATVESSEMKEEAEPEDE